MTLATAARPAPPVAAFQRRAYLTRDEVAQILGVKEALVRQWVRDRTIPEAWHGPAGYAPICVALGELMLELGRFFGQNSHLPKQIARAFASKLETVWQHPEWPVAMTVSKDDLTVNAELTFMARAQEKLAAFTSA